LAKLGVGIPADAGFKQNVCHPLHDDPTSDTANYNATLTLRQPAFLSPRHTASVALFAERRSEFNAYTRQAVGANLAMTFNARRNIPVTLGYGYSVGRTTAAPAIYCQLFRLCDASEQAFLSNRRRFGAVTISGVRNQMNSVLDPTAGGIVTASLTHSSRLVGSDTLYEFNRGQLEVSRYYPIGRRGAFAWRVLGGTILPARRISFAGQSVRFVPPDQRFYGGGPSSVRGYARNELGPRVYFRSISVDSVKGDTTFGNLQASATGGNAIFVANAELRIPTPLFPDRMRVAVFADVGQVWELEDPSVRGVRFTPGVGVRFVTPLGPVRVGTGAGRGLLARVMESALAQVFTGSIEVADVRGSLLTGVTLTGVRLFDADTTLVAWLPRADLTYNPFDFAAGRVVFFEFALRQPVITLVQHRSGRLNIEELLRLGGPDSGHGPHGPATLILFRNVQIEDGTLTLRLQAQRAEPGDTALEIQGGGPNGRVRVRRFEHLDARLAALQVSSPVERGIGIDISRLAVESSDPALRLVDVAGRLHVIGDSLEFDLSRVRFPGSALRAARGRVSWPRGPLLFDLSLHADSATLGDFHFI